MTILISFLFYFSKKENWIYKLSFRFSYPNSIPHIQTPIYRIPT